MADRKANCLVCGGAITYYAEAQSVVCAICGSESYSNAVCERGHYVCDPCHRRKGVQRIIAACLEETSSNPIEIADKLMAHPSVHANGPEHHTLVGASLLCAYRNAGGAVDLPAALSELERRSMQVPGGTCGYWGCCGAATSAGQFYSIVSGSTPLAEKAWGDTARLTSLVLGRIADYGGPRCCKRTGFLAMETTVPYVAETLGVKMELPDKVVCRHFPYNAECLKLRCPFYPIGTARCE